MRERRWFTANFQTTWKAPETKKAAEVSLGGFRVLVQLQTEVALWILLANGRGAHMRTLKRPQSCPEIRIFGFGPCRGCFESELSHGLNNIYYGSATCQDSF